MKVNPSGLTGVNSPMGVVARATLRKRSGKRTMCSILRNRVATTEIRGSYI